MDRNFIAAKKGTKKLVMQYNDNLKYICSLCGSFWQMDQNVKWFVYRGQVDIKSEVF